MTTKVFENVFMDNINGLGPKGFNAVKESLGARQPAILIDDPNSDVVFATAISTFLDNVSMVGPTRTPFDIHLVMNEFGFQPDSLDHKNRPAFSRTLMRGVNSILNKDCTPGGLNVSALIAKTL